MLRHVSLIALLFLAAAGSPFALDEKAEKEASLKLNQAFAAFFADKPVAAAKAFEEVFDRLLASATLLEMPRGARSALERR